MVFIFLLEREGGGGWGRVFLSFSWKCFVTTTKQPNAKSGWLLSNSNLPPSDYGTTILSLYTKAVSDSKSLLSHNHVLMTASPQVTKEETNLPRPCRATSRGNMGRPEIIRALNCPYRYRHQIFHIDVWCQIAQEVFCFNLVPNYPRPFHIHPLLVAEAPRFFPSSNFFPKFFLPSKLFFLHQFSLPNFFLRDFHLSVSPHHSAPSITYSRGLSHFNKNQK